MVCTPQLRRHENILALRFPFFDGRGNTLADFFLVLVAERRVDVPVPDRQRVADGSRYFTTARLPCACDGG